MKKIKLLVALVLLFSNSMHADFSIDWVRTPNILTSSGTSIALDSADNVYTTTSIGSIILEKRDRFGNLKWQVSSSTTLAFNYEYPVQVFTDPQGNPVVLGYRHTQSSDGHNANAIIILKYDPNGTLIYKHNIDGSYSYFNNSRYWTNVSGQMDSNGNLYVGTAGNVNGQPTWGFNAIKISPSGNIIRVSTKNFPSGSNFHFVTRIRLQNDKLGLTGVTNYSSANATTWVLDTAGTDLWNAISSGVQGKDIAFDGNGNAYMLTWISTLQSGDIALYKFDNSGSQLWLQTYDFGGSELSSQLEKTPDGGFAIMAYGNLGPTSGYYVDWITLKVDSAGNNLWSDRYDEQSTNDEYPQKMGLDTAGNIFLTGIGGPFPGGSNLGKRQMVTVKYTPSGSRDWASQIDTINEYLTGVGLCVGNDNSLFVVGDVNTFIVHYLDHTGTNACSVPVNIISSSVLFDSAIISWDSVPDAYLYHVRYKTSASLTWEMVSTDSLSVLISSLFPGTVYDFSVEAICNSGPTGFSATQQFTTQGNGYCTSRGLDGSHDWIDLVYIENLLNSTPVTDGGYADYTYLSADLSPGQTYDITLSAGMDPYGSTENWKVWIDFNRNSSFSDPGEELVSYSSVQIGWETSTFTIPTTVTPGPTIMRVSMKNGSVAPTPCEIFTMGEVEDYTINISGTTSLPLTDSQSKNGLELFPNPGMNLLFVKKNLAMEKTTIRIADMTGRIVLEQENYDYTIPIHTDQFAAGVYMVILSDESGLTQTAKWTKSN